MPCFKYQPPPILLPNYKDTEARHAIFYVTLKSIEFCLQPKERRWTFKLLNAQGHRVCLQPKERHGTFKLLNAQGHRVCLQPKEWRGTFKLLNTQGHRVCLQPKERVGHSNYRKSNLIRSAT